ncbi:hypothetical protein HYH02_012830 [Chlamydomonas schloesseri]|uniref:Membrane insertase YidC/Oxa/ALB C-terminal domain-containing protein n=1 Tax=Chlamydomonas schloesseri TaxID=2026947 RepID=A0A835T3E3_9CHLO|nr:hypothetical protein HYH02_012830 [Chlamydomonas schloesseri]|eukprot:KAG2433129.1 hypothetical protein HYH02_012830 [Chlamydomonas schloesseri]
MAQRWRALQRGAALLAHHSAESGASTQLLSACSTSTSSLLQQIARDQRSGGSASWAHQHAWGSSSGHRTFFSFSRKKSDAGAVAAASTSDDATNSSTEPVADPTPAGPPEFFPLPESAPDAIEVASAIHQATNALERASILSAKADAFFSASWCISGLQAVHDSLGTPWFLSIAIFNITLRLLTFPLMVVAQKGSAKMMEFNHDLIHAKKLQEAAMKATSQEEHQRLFTAFRNEYSVQTAKHGDPVKTALVVPGVMLLNGAIFISIFNGISKLMAAKVPSLTTGGALWFTDLTSPDPYFGLPLMCTAVTLAMVEYGINLAGDAGPMADDRAKMTRGLKNFMRVMAFMFLPAGGYVAAGTAVLWVSNTAFGVLQGLTLRSDAFRRRVGLPTMQALRDMNAKVMAANAAGTPAGGGAAGASAAATLAAAATDRSAPASAAPLLSNSPAAKARR